MTETVVAHHVQGDRLWDRLMALARHGATERAGVCRLALSQEEINARAELIALGRDMGLGISADTAGNLFFRLSCGDLALAPVMTGSHIDSQPAGGRFDGSFGVLAGLEVLAAVQAAQLRLARDLVVAIWMNEEGARFAPGMMGSSAFAGLRDLDEISAVRDDAGISVVQALTDVAAAFPDILQTAPGFPVHAFVEAHIEQGTVLEDAGVPVGVVTGIQGSRRFRITVTGTEAHAGTEPYSRRRDALFSALDIVQALRNMLHDPKDILRFTVGQFKIAPNAPSVVPARAYFSIDLRHPDNDVLGPLGDRIAGIAQDYCGPCDVQIVEIAHAPSVMFSPGIGDTIAAAADATGIRQMRLLSAAGHDARQLHHHCPTGMLFIPCSGGISHNPAEYCTPEDVTDGARVLAETLVRLAE